MLRRNSGKRKDPAVLSQQSHDHGVMFYSSGEELAETVSQFLLDTIKRGGVGISVATAAHSRYIEALLARGGIDPAAARASGHYVALDAKQTMDRFVVNGWPDPAAFYKTLSPVLKRATRRRRQVRVFGEMVSLLWESGQFSAAIDLEALWTELGQQHRFSLLCAYRQAQAGSTENDELALVLDEHDKVLGRTGREHHGAMSA
jgi:hypothetical protein